MRRRVVLAWLVAGMLLAGCNSTTSRQPSSRPMSLDQRQQRAIENPWDDSLYNTQEDRNSDISRTDKDGIKRDLDHVLNP